MSWSLFRFGKGLYKEEYRCPGKKLDWDSNTGNCKYYVFEKASLCFGKGLYKEEYRCPGKKLDWDSNTGNCKYYVFEKASLCLQTMVHFETHVYTVEPRSSLISSSVGRAV